MVAEKIKEKPKMIILNINRKVKMKNKEHKKMGWPRQGRTCAELPTVCRNVRRIGVSVQGAPIQRFRHQGSSLAPTCRSWWAGAFIRPPLRKKGGNRKTKK